jgi:hypothetical protein
LRAISAPMPELAPVTKAVCCKDFTKRDPFQFLQLFAIACLRCPRKFG